MNTQNYNSIEEDEIDLKELFLVIKNNIWKILFFVALVTFCTFIYVLSIPNSYKSSVVLSPMGEQKSSMSSLSSLASLAGINIGSKSGGIEPLVMMQTTLSDYEFNKVVIEKYNLIKKLENQNNLVFALGIDFFYNLFNSKSDEKKEDEDKEDKIYTIYKLISSILDLTSDKKTSLITLSATLNDRYLAKELVDIYLREIIEHVKINDMKDLDNQISFYKNELNSVKDVATKEQLSKSLSSLLQKRVFSKANEYYFVTKLTNSRVSYIKEKTKPKRALILIVSFITSFILGIFIVFFIKFIKNEEN